MLRTVWIARHANRLDFVDPDWFKTAEKRYDPPLSEDGFLQAKQLGQRLKSEGIKKIFVSPFLRTIQTASEVAEILDLPIYLEAGLSEWLNPHWMTESPITHPQNFLAESYSRIDWSYQSVATATYPETESSMMLRTAETARLLVENHSEEILMIGHGASVIGTTTGLVGGQPVINASLCCLVKVVDYGDRWQMELNGDTSHLDQTESTIRFN